MQIGYSQSTDIFSLKDKSINKFDFELNRKVKGLDKVNNSERITKASKSGNAFNFMYLGPILDGFNTMYAVTKDEKYLKYGYEIISQVINSSKTSKSNAKFKTWYVSTSQERYKETNNKEWMLFEGHFFRYAVQYLYLVNQNKKIISDKLIVENNEVFVDFIHKNVWNKWLDASIRTRGDLTLLYGVRVHNGAHWATIALYLNRLVKEDKDESKFKEYYLDYDKQLRKNFALENDIYVWNSTWDDVFLQAHKDRKAKKLDKSRIQDTAHGNHVVQYIISSYKLGGGWEKKDLNYLANTLTDKILNNKNFLPSENIDGSGKIKYIDLSDGWFKLSNYNEDCKSKLKEFYKMNQSSIDNGFQNLQFYALITSLNSNK